VFHQFSDFSGPNFGQIHAHVLLASLFTLVVQHAIGHKLHFWVAICLISIFAVVNKLTSNQIIQNIQSPKNRHQIIQIIQAPKNRHSFILGRR